MKSILSSLVLLSLISCQSYSQPAMPEPVDDKKFNDYWYAGEAELASYELKQARYGEIHDGHAVLVFVTEPFSESKQVKLDYPGRAPEDNVSVLKLNFTKKFLTGVYPYSMMQSVFTPVSYDRYPNTLKVSTSSQEWCGHTFMQLNLAKNDYQLKGFSYFESEGDLERKVNKVFLEDEIWNRIRLNPASLPTGSIDILPGTFYLRLRHKGSETLRANVSLVSLNNSEFGDNAHRRYTLQYEDRSLDIYFEDTFPYRILGWEEKYQSGFRNAQQLSTKAFLKKSIKSPYWQKNSNADRALRKELGLLAE